MLLSLFPGLFSLLQLFLEGDNLLLGGGQLVFDISEKYSLTLDLPLYTIQGSGGTLSFPLHGLPLFTIQGRVNPSLSLSG